MKSFWKRNHKIPDKKEQAAEIKNELNSGLNSVSILVEKGLIRYDLEGKQHGEVETPHKHFYQKNKIDGIIKSFSKAFKHPEPINQQDLRTIVKYKKK